MAWILFNRDFEWPPMNRWSVAYKDGMRCNVTTECAADAMAAGAAVEIDVPSRAEAEQLKVDPHWTGDLADLPAITDLASDEAAAVPLTISGEAEPAPEPQPDPEPAPPEEPAAEA